MATSDSSLPSGLPAPLPESYRNLIAFARTQTIDDIDALVMAGKFDPILGFVEDPTIGTLEAWDSRSAATPGDPRNSVLEEAAKEVTSSKAQPAPLNVSIGHVPAAHRVELMPTYRVTGAEVIYSDPQLYHGAGRGSDIYRQDRTSSGPGPRVIDVSTLIGGSVFDAGGEKLGKIEAVMVDPVLSKIAYTVLSFGGFLGLGHKRLAIPWAAMTQEVNGNHLILNVSRERLANAPEFDSDHRPPMENSECATNYEVRPYWDENREGSASARTRTWATMGTLGVPGPVPRKSY